MSRLKGNYELLNFTVLNTFLIFKAGIPFVEGVYIVFFPRQYLFLDSMLISAGQNKML